MNLSIYWTDQAVTEIGHTLHGDDEETVEFNVLRLARILYALEHRTMITKEKAGLYALKKLPPQWHRIIREALRIRNVRLEPSLYENKQLRAQETKDFVRYMIDYCHEKHRLF